MKKKDTYLLNYCIAISIIIAGVLLYQHFEVSEVPEVKPVVENKITTPEKVFGFDKEQFHFETHNLGFNQNLGDLLLYQGIEWDSILKLDKLSDNVFSIRKFRANKDITFVREDECSSPHCIIYEPNKFTYIKYHIKDQVKIDVVKKNFEVCHETASGIIESSLWASMLNSGLSSDIIDKMEDAFASTVDFYHTQKGDEFKLFYEKKYIDGEAVANGEILAASFKDAQGEHFAVYYENDNYSGFYDLEGRPTKGTFLRAPLKAARISSRYNLRRFHPIKKKRIPHLGTDYAAPTGTPIYAVGHGVIEIAGYSKNNGKYVKIKHDKVHQTQYLHMNKIAPGIKKGVRVKQGQKIGEVGQTGLATGPHVCFRFWKNGRQVNHLRENFPPQDPLPGDELPKFYEQRDQLMSTLQTINYPSDPENLSYLAMNKP